jgi:hypothetical protein
MHLLPPGAPPDALFASVRRGHPDLDIVVLTTPEPSDVGKAHARRLVRT